MLKGVRSLYSALLVLGPLTPAPLMAQATTLPEKAWSQFVAEGQRLQALGRYGEAESSFKSALDRADTPLAKAKTMNYLALAKQLRGDYQAAASLYGGARNILDQHPAPLDMALLLLN